MIQFLIGLLVGIGVCVFASVLATADEDREDLCKGCPYEDYSAGKKDCMYCHDADDGR